MTHRSAIRLLHFPSACRERPDVQFLVDGSHMCCVELALKGWFPPASAVKERLGLLVLLLPDGYTILMRPSKVETAHGCHCPGDMGVRIRKARPWIGVRVCHLLLLLIFVTHCFFKVKF